MAKVSFGFLDWTSHQQGLNKNNNKTNEALILKWRLILTHGGVDRRVMGPARCLDIS